MRRKEKQVASREEVDAIIGGSQVCRLALAVDNMPYIVPLSFGYDGDAIYIHTARTGKKIEYFEVNNRVCFEFERNVRFVRDDSGPCESTFAFETAIGYGTIIELLKPDAKAYALDRIARQYTDTESVFDSKTLEKVRLWKISIESVEGKRSPGGTDRSSTGP